MIQVQQLVVGIEDGEPRLDRFLKRHFPQITQGWIEKACRTGQIRVDGKRAGAADRLSVGQSVRVPPLPEAPLPAGSRFKLPARDVEYIRSLVIHRDEHVIALNKPSGLATQGGTKTLRHVDGLLDGLMFEKETRPKLVHRLDRDTSGVLILGRTASAAAHLARSFKSRYSDKIYWAVTNGVPSPHVGEIRCWMVKDRGPMEADREQVRRAAQNEEGAQFSITHYRVVSHAAQKVAWVSMKPTTGRTHQLRFHMAEIGTAILGDYKYTCHRDPPTGLDDVLHLHARALMIPHPAGGTLSLQADMPAHMKRTFEALGFDPRDEKRPLEGWPEEKLP